MGGERRSGEEVRWVVWCVGGGGGCRASGRGSGGGAVYMGRRRHFARCLGA